MTNHPIKQIETDILVIGSGGSGASAAQQAAELGAKVMLVSKDPIACSDSKISEGIITVRDSGKRQDSELNLANNMRLQGDNLASKDITKRFAQYSKQSYQWLRRMGLKSGQVQHNGDAAAMNLPMGGHNRARSVEHVNNGLDYGHACWNAVTQSNIEYMEDTWVLDCYVRENQEAPTVTGALLWHGLSGEFLSVYCSQVILACGGASTLYAPHSDTMRGNTGDGYAIALRAGAALVDMEQVQFIPFAVAKPGNDLGLILGEPVSAGILGKITDKHGKVILSEVMTRTRAECCAAMAKAISEGNGTNNDGCFLDLTDNAFGKSGVLFQKLLKEKVPGLLKTARRALGHDAANMNLPWEVKPSAHYFMGGVYCNENGQALTSQHQIIKGLYACGQVMGGVHGSNRLGSTSLAEAVIFGGIAGRHAAENISPITNETLRFNQAQAKKLLNNWCQARASEQSVSPVALLRQLQKNAWQSIGPARDENTMVQFSQWLEQLEKQLRDVHTGEVNCWNQLFIDKIETQNLLICAKSIVSSSLLRRVSLGAHYRTDSLSRNSEHYSVLSFKQQAKLVNIKVPRKSPSHYQQWQHDTQIKIRQGVFRTIRKLPKNIKDKILCRIYTKALRPPVVRTTKSHTTHPIKVTD